jgi:hypothetical protein
MSVLRGAVAIALAAAVLAGCGGGDDDDGGLSRSELNTQSEAICKDGRDQLNDLSSPDLSDPDQAAAFLTDAVAIFDATIKKLRALEPEDDLKDDYEAYVAIVDENGDQLKGILAKAKARDASGERDLNAYLNDSARDRRTKDAAVKAGLTGCAAT